MDIPADKHLLYRHPGHALRRPGAKGNFTVESLWLHLWGVERTIHRRKNPYKKNTSWYISMSTTTLEKCALRKKSVSQHTYVP